MNIWTPNTCACPHTYMQQLAWLISQIRQTRNIPFIFYQTVHVIYRSPLIININIGISGCMYGLLKNFKKKSIQIRTPILTSSSSTLLDYV